MNDFIAGCFGGIFGTFVVYPFDTWRIRLQSNISIKKNLYSGVASPMLGIGLEKSIVFGSHSIIKKYSPNEFVTGLCSGFFASLVVTPIERWKIMKQNKPSLLYSEIVRSSLKNGIGSLYNGLSACFLREVPGYAIYFQTYSMLHSNNHHFTWIHKDNHIFKTMLYGGLSGMNSWIFIYPFDTIKTNMQHNSSTFLETTRDLYNSGALYRGFHLGLFRAFLLHSCVFLGYETVHSYLHKDIHEK